MIHGQVKWISPLSGHYKCSTDAFKLALRKLEEDCGVDLSHARVDMSIKALKVLETVSKIKHK